MMDAECLENIQVFDRLIEGEMAFVFSAWDNRDGETVNFEYPDSCPTPAASCDSAEVAFSNVSFKYQGSNWDPKDEEDSEEEEIIEPADFEAFIGNVDSTGDQEFYVKGINGSVLET